VFLVGCGFSTPDGGSLGPDDATPTGDSATATGDGGPPLDAAMPDVMIDAPGCPASFVTVPAANSSSRYQAFPKMSQLAAIATCAGMNTHLARIDTQAEADALVTFIASINTGPPIAPLFRVVGTRDPLLRNYWHDLDLSILTFLPWGSGEPSDAAFGFEDCIVLKKEQASAVFDAQECNSQHEFACECD